MSIIAARNKKKKKKNTFTDEEGNIYLGQGIWGKPTSTKNKTPVAANPPTMKRLEKLLTQGIISSVDEDKKLPIKQKNKPTKKKTEQSIDYLDVTTKDIGSKSPPTSTKHIPMETSNTAKKQRKKYPIDYLDFTKEEIGNRSNTKPSRPDTKPGIGAAPAANKPSVTKREVRSIDYLDVTKEEIYGTDTNKEINHKDASPEQNVVRKKATNENKNPLKVTIPLSPRKPDSYEYETRKGQVRNPQTTADTTEQTGAPFFLAPKAPPPLNKDKEQKIPFMHEAYMEKNLSWKEFNQLSSKEQKKMMKNYHTKNKSN